MAKKNTYGHLACSCLCKKPSISFGKFVISAEQCLKFTIAANSPSKLQHIFSYTGKLSSFRKFAMYKMQWWIWLNVSKLEPSAILPWIPCRNSVQNFKTFSWENWWRSKLKAHLNFILWWNIAYSIRQNFPNILFLASWRWAVEIKQSNMAQTFGYLWLDSRFVDFLQRKYECSRLNEPKKPLKHFI